MARVAPSERFRAQLDEALAGVGQEDLIVQLRSHVAGHAGVDDVEEVASKDASGLLFGVVVGARACVKGLGARLPAQLGEGHPVQDRVDSPAAAGVIAMTDRLAGPLAFIRASDAIIGAIEARHAARIGAPAYARVRRHRQSITPQQPKE